MVDARGSGKEEARYDEVCLDSFFPSKMINEEDSRSERDQAQYPIHQFRGTIALTVPLSLTAKWVNLIMNFNML